MARACLSFLSKKDQGQLLPGRNLLVFSGGEKTMGPGKTWACLSFLSKKEQQMPGSCLTLGSAGEKRPLACLFYLKRSNRCPVGSGNKKPPTFLSGVLGGFDKQTCQTASTRKYCGKF
jgi:hypothetical protein